LEEICYNKQEQREKDMLDEKTLERLLKRAERTSRQHDIRFGLALSNELNETNARLHQLCEEANPAYYLKQTREQCEPAISWLWDQISK